MQLLVARHNHRPDCENPKPMGIEYAENSIFDPGPQEACLDMLKRGNGKRHSGEILIFTAEHAR